MMTVLACLALAFVLLSSITVPTGRVPMMPVRGPSGAVLPRSIAREMRDAVGRTSDGLCGALFDSEIAAASRAAVVASVPQSHTFRLYGGVAV